MDKVELNNKLEELKRKEALLFKTGNFRANNGDGFSQADIDLMNVQHEIEETEKLLKEA